MFEKAQKRVQNSEREGGKKVQGKTKNPQSNRGNKGSGYYGRIHLHENPQF